MQGVKGTCVVCQHPDRVALDARLVRGDPYDSVAEMAGVTTMTAKRHLDNGHIGPEHTKQLREWFQKNGVERQLEKARISALAEVDDTPDLTPKDLQRRLLFLERYTYRVLERIESQADPNDRSALLGVESVRRLCMDLFTLTKGEQAQATTDSVDVQALRASILEAVGKGKPDGWQPLR